MSKSRQWTLLAVAATLAVIAAGWFVVVSPARTEAQVVSAEALRERTAVRSLTTQLEVLQAQAAELPEQQARLAELQGALPETVELPSLVRQLTAAAADTDVELDSVAPGTPTVAGDHTLVPVVLSIRGSFFLLEQFLNSLEELPRAFVVTNFTLQAGAEGSGELQMSLTGNAFARAAATAPAAVPQSTAAAPAGGSASTSPAGAAAAPPTSATAATAAPAR